MKFNVFLENWGECKMKTKLAIIIVLLLSQITFAQKPVTSYSFKSTKAELWPNEQNLCNYATVSIERKEETGKPTETLVGYQLRNCDDSIYAYTNPTLVNPSSYVIDTRNGTQTLTLTSPINATITWKYPATKKDTTDFNWKTEIGSKIENRREITEVSNALVEGYIGNKVVGSFTGASVTVKSITVFEGK